MLSNIPTEPILEAAYDMLIEKGFKSTTMDALARRLQMSKRTLYEIFDSKNDLLLKALDHHGRLHEIKCEELILSSSNLIEGLVRIFNFLKEDLKRVNLDYFRDLDRLCYPLRNDFEARRTKIIAQLDLLFMKGVEQGIFLESLNFKAIVRVALLQMESLKRMESNFADDLSLADIFDTMSICFLRGVVSSKGMILLDEALSKDYN